MRLHFPIQVSASANRSSIQHLSWKAIAMDESQKLPELMDVASRPVEESKPEPGALEALEGRREPAATDGRMSGGHGDVHAETSEKLVGLRQHEPERKATGLKAVVSSFHYAWSEAGPIRG